MNNGKKSDLCIHGKLDMSNFLAQVMPKFTENFGMTYARKCIYKAPEICRNGNESTFPAKHRPLGFPANDSKHYMC